ncbi:MAG: oligosaccharide flippase family protein [Anaerolineae bacterium]|jgi:O-antigen/teichoic acid export membrane protein
MSVARRSVTAAAWNIVSSLGRVVVLFVRSIILARLLPVEVFGIYAFAMSIVTLSSALPNFGMSGAFLHRAPESQDEKQLAAVHFTLKGLFTLVWAAVLLGVAMIFTRGETRLALMLLTVIYGGIHLAQTPRLILTRRVVHRRMALLQLVDALLSSILAIALAWKGVTLWALIGTDAVTLAVTIFGLYVWRPVWRPRVAWSPQVVRYLISFGSRILVADLLMRALDRVDDLWTGLALGETALGFYSRAYTFAIYPRFILARPINAVAGGTYAELKGDRIRLSKAFFRTNAFLVRTSFLLGGLLALVAPEFIRLALGEKWLPMLTAFRLMLVYTLFDPIKLTIADVLTASGAPGKVIRARAIQLTVLFAGLLTLGTWFGIAGVAIAVDAMLVVGIAILLWQVRAYVDYSIRGLFLIPGLALVVGVVLASLVVAHPALQASDWITGAVKIVVFSCSYLGILLVLERREIPRYLRLLRQLLPGQGHDTPQVGGLL